MWNKQPCPAWREAPETSTNFLPRLRGKITWPSRRTPVVWEDSEDWNRQDSAARCLSKIPLMEPIPWFSPPRAAAMGAGRPLPKSSRVRRNGPPVLPRRDTHPILNRKCPAPYSLFLSLRKRQTHYPGGRRKVMHGVWFTSRVRLNLQGFAREWHDPTTNLHTQKKYPNEECFTVGDVLAFWPLHTCDQFSYSLSPSPYSANPGFYFELQHCPQTTSLPRLPCS